MPFGLQPQDVIIILIVAFFIFGPKKLPEIGRYVGKTITEFRVGTRELTENLRDEAGKPVSSHPSQEHPSNAGNFCTRCGVPNAPEGRFCENCGTPLTEADIKTEKEAE